MSSKESPSGGVMRVKNVTLYSLPYIVGVASLVVAVHEVVPGFKPLPLLSTSTPSAIFSGQVINRSLKSDRLPIEQAPSQASKSIKSPIQIKVPAQITPNQKLKTDCDTGRCLADAGQYRKVT
jgi:hypothetical protein